MWLPMHVQMLTSTWFQSCKEKLHHFNTSKSNSQSYCTNVMIIMDKVRPTSF